MQNIWKNKQKQLHKELYKMQKKFKVSLTSPRGTFFPFHPPINQYEVFFFSWSQAVKLFFIRCFTDWQMREREVLWKDTTGGKRAGSRLSKTAGSEREKDRVRETEREREKDGGRVRVCVHNRKRWRHSSHHSLWGIFLLHAFLHSACPAGLQRIPSEI